MHRRHFIRTGAITSLVAGTFGSTSRPLAALVAPPGRRGANGQVRLSSNENPLGISDAARDAVIEAISVANRYPQVQRGALVATLARAHDVGDEQVVMGVGSSEILQMAIQAFSAPKARLVMADPTYEDASVYQATEAYELVKVPLTSSYEHDLERMRDEAEASGRPAVVYLCNPNNPTGTVTPSASIDAWIAEAPEHVFFIADEAYGEYVEDRRVWTALPWVEKKRNVLVVKTFSKIYGMAGLRLGYGIAHRDTAVRIADFVAKNNTNQLAIAAAAVSFQDEALIRKSRAMNREAREMTQATLDELDLEYLPTETNFIMHRIGGDLGTYRSRMAEAGFLVGRPFPPMTRWNRLSFGLPDDMARFCDTLKGFRAKGWV